MYIIHPLSKILFESLLTMSDFQERLEAHARIRASFLEEKENWGMVYAIEMNNARKAKLDTGETNISLHGYSVFQPDAGTPKQTLDFLNLKVMDILDAQRHVPKLIDLKMVLPFRPVQCNSAYGFIGSYGGKMSLFDKPGDGSKTKAAR